VTSDPSSPPRPDAARAPEDVRPDGAEPDSAPSAAQPAPQADVEPAPDPGAASAEDHGRAVAERDEYLDALRRLKADFENYRKRSERDRQAFAQTAARDLVTDLLPVLDNLERAVEALDGQEPSVVAGVAMVREQLAGLLAGRGVTEIEAHERPFDPSVHEAVVTSPSPDHEDGLVLAVIQKGYRLHDAVLRPARVVVSAGSG
jgi:molecular chaperone GrpE